MANLKKKNREWLAKAKHEAHVVQEAMKAEQRDRDRENLAKKTSLKEKLRGIRSEMEHVKKKTEQLLEKAENLRNNIRKPDEKTVQEIINS